MGFELEGRSTNSSITRGYYSGLLEIKYAPESIFFTGSLSYRLCLQSEIDQPVTVYQSGQVNLLPAKTQMVIKQEEKIVIHSDGYALVDLFECSDRAQIRVSTSTKEIDLSSSRVYSTDISGIPQQSHAIRFTE